MRLFLTAILGLSFNCATPAIADPGKPVAVRWWGQGMFSIETWWNLTIVIDPYNDKIGNEVPEVLADAVLLTQQDRYRTDLDADRVNSKIGHESFQDGFERDRGWWLRNSRRYIGRLPNSDTIISELAGARYKTQLEGVPHQILVYHVPSSSEEVDDSNPGDSVLVVIRVDGVSIVHCGDLGQSKLTETQLDLLGNVDVLLLPLGGVYHIKGDQGWDIVDQVKPRIVVPLRYTTEELNATMAVRAEFTKYLPKRESWTIKPPEHNTLAARRTQGDNRQNAAILAPLDDQPWQPTGELAELLDKMDAACRASQEVFRPLSANQMNWQPPDGSHTPRWNAEHMLGRQLGFFSQIYAAIDGDTFSHLDLNPAQMPKDYEPAHPDWDGAETARQMERANAYVRRFAYLLDDVPLDEPAPGSRWTLRGLLQQMDRHFAEHTANVKKKFELDGWPEE